MKKNITLLVLIVIALTVGFSSCGGGEPSAKTKEAPTPLNLTIYLDLSNRISPTISSQQVQRDTTIVLRLLDNYIKKAQKESFVKCKDRVKVFFYPEPNQPAICQLAEKLDLDLNKTKAVDKAKKVKKLRQQFSESLSQIYSQTIMDANWVGSDIWGFFDTKVEDYCIRKGFRNVLVILTDGYLYHQNNLQRQGDAYSYIENSSLNNPKSSLIVKRDNLQDLEVWFFELNPRQPKSKEKMKAMISDWLKSMNVKHYEIKESDNPNNTKDIVDRIFE